MPSGGWRGGGRPKGSLAKRTKMLRAIAEDALTNGVTPLEVMLENMRFYYDKATKSEELLKKIIGKDPPIEVLKVLKELCDFRLAAQSCAVDASPYVHAKLSSVTVGGDKDNPLKVVQSVERFFFNPDSDGESPSISHTTDISPIN